MVREKVLLYYVPPLFMYHHFMIIMENLEMGLISDLILRGRKEKLVKKMVDEESSLISVYYGADTKEEDAVKLVDELTEAFGDCEIELQNGGQPVYYYIISVE